MTTIKRFFVYCLESNITKNTYIGATINVNHRLRQHNREITGGAKITSRHVLNGEKWSIRCYVSNFPTWNEALKFEWQWKNITRRVCKQIPFTTLLKITGGYDTSFWRRLLALNILLKIPRATCSAQPYNTWPLLPQIHILQYKSLPGFPEEKFFVSTMDDNGQAS